MKKDDLIILLIAMLLLAGMLITLFFGGERSRHGVGVRNHEKILRFSRIVMPSMKFTGAKTCSRPRTYAYQHHCCLNQKLLHRKSDDTCSLSRYA